MISITNLGAYPFSGWTRTTIDSLPSRTSGRCGTYQYVVGRKVGSSTWTCDVKIPSLGPKQSVSLDLDDSVLVDRPSTAPVGLETFGGAPSINGQYLSLEKFFEDGAGQVVQAHARLGALLHVRMWFLWRAEEPGIMHCEAVFTASNGAVPDLFQTITDLKFKWGDAAIHVPGRGWTDTLVQHTSFASGMCRAVPFTLIWPRLLTTETFIAALGAVTGSMSSRGVSKLWPGGNPRVAAGFSPDAWMAANYTPTLAALHSWDAPSIGPNKRSADAGAQEDQIFVRGEQNGEVVAYYASLSLMKRPCHFLEEDGSQADPSNHPNCVFWAGKPHWHLGVSPDQLGKPRQPNDAECFGWGGPDREHWLANSLAAAARLTGSYALQWELSQQARLFLFSETVPSMKPGWSTNGADAARSIGYAGILVTHLWHCLEDRSLAQRVVDRWHARVREVYIPQCGNATDDIWDKRLDDPRLGSGLWWMPWQQALGAYGLHLACTEVGPIEGIELALRGARAVLERGWKFDQNTSEWVTGSQGYPVSGQVNWTNEFRYFGMPLAPATVLRSDPQDARARAIWDQLVAGPGSRTWLPPEIA